MRSTAMMGHQRKITLGEMREMGVRGLLVYCSDYKCGHWGKISADRYRTIPVCLTWKPCSFVRPVASKAAISGRTSSGTGDRSGALKSWAARAGTQAETCVGGVK